jgi:RNA polymerase sigma factor (TIGR02999 family)
MGRAGADDVTELLLQWGGGNRSALDRLMPVVYGELRRVAGRYLRHERPNHTLQPTVLVHEAYLRLMDQRRAQWQNRAHFFGIAAQLMRRVLVDHARRHGAAKRGGGRTQQLDSAIVAVTAARDVTVLALDEALTRLAALDPQQARVIELRCFGGLTIDETAVALGVSIDVVKREWRLAKAWLYRELDQGART